MKSAVSGPLVLCSLLFGHCASRADAMATKGNSEGLVVRVTASYPGASARVVADTVAAPIEQQVSGVEGATVLESESRNDGSYALTIHLETTADPDQVVKLVQTRVELAEPQLPEECRRQKVAVRKAPDGLPTFWLAVTSVTHSEAELTGIATRTIGSAFSGSAGVAEVRTVGGRDRRIILTFDSAALSARGTKVEKIEKELKSKKLQVAPGWPVDGNLVLELASEPPVDLEKLGKTVVGTISGMDIELRDVARIRDGSVPRGFASANGRSAPLVAVTAWPGKLTRADVRKVLDGIKGLPKGVRVELVSDVSMGSLALAHVRWPDATRREQVQEVIARAGKLLGEKVGVTEWIAFGEELESGAATILFTLPRGRATAVADARKVLRELRDTSCVVSEISNGQHPFPVRIAVCGTGDRGAEDLAKVANALVDRMRAKGTVVDATARPGSPRPELSVNVDRAKMKALGVTIEDVAAAIRATGVTVTADDNKFASETIVRVTPMPEQLDEILSLYVLGEKGKPVQLSALCSLRKVSAPQQVVRVNLCPAVVLSGVPPAGTSASDSIAQSLELAGAVLPKGYKARPLPPASR
ncbi:hydrophobe amphiphile efflux-1 family transporter : Transporter, hydrophobe/amphiphile efflux-1 (HAE1) family OS=Planctomyces limnophilus (strain ATCC 43296 / DSM 3776 / IFAM 1008 / 290) GN=Plim_2886 PE=4 SV=1: ACR_tran: ACR_tran [Gemmata massiliana]|uniref:NolW-like domain-containing protein n=1 Tax=Gemmata massiliana TaxID=1210884 RepID=A0A6P2DFR8_9BACT|nr:efflux RND transporter permease subunit [Gemmata massiliana]VTS01354.1 hydrophobe amphiphile efflux-1 family transporter : Transporter, hydrophobe/amphiphile efflux-1 (HAE1) family OS=Planctomyces limnophilus (strain ATCC 43296 / DSM 3776 / IFAM 1008 / 290) GN=Plim_2886 PE=4 SV=1: ACR_tran: ACR_tran [Gemmata massiliana]